MVEQKQKAKQSEFVRWFAPLLQALKDLGGSAAPREALERIAQIEKVPESLRNEILSSGQERFFELWGAISTKCKTDPLDYLNMLQRHAVQVAAAPNQWLPWN